MSKDFLKLVGVALLLGLPLAWYAINTWLKDFAYRIEMEWWVFALAGIIAIGLALVSVSSQSLKAALVNPVDSLKND